MAPRDMYLTVSHLTLKIYFYFIIDPRSFEFYKDFRILPGSSSQTRLNEDFKILIARSIVTHVPAFKCFSNYVNKNINHAFQKEMTQKSEVVRC